MKEERELMKGVDHIKTVRMTVSIETDKTF